MYLLHFMMETLTNMFCWQELEQEKKSRLSGTNGAMSGYQCPPLLSSLTLSSSLSVSLIVLEFAHRVCAESLKHCDKIKP